MPNRRLLNLHPMSNEPIVSEVVPVDTPVISDSPTPDVIKEPESPVEKTDTHETPTPAEEILLSDEEVDEAIEAILKDMPLTVATEPTAFLWKEEVAKEVDALTVMVDEYQQSELAKAEALQKAADTETKNKELENFVEDIKTSYSKISDILGTDVADKITAWDTDIPLHLYSDKMEKVYAHPFFGPHVKTLLEGWEVDLPKLLKETLTRTRIPNVADTPTTPTPEPKPPSVVNGLVSRLRAGHRM